MWVIVKFPKENCVEAIPNNWLIGDSSCYWPPYSGNRLKKAVLICEEPGTNWEIIDVVVLSKTAIDAYNKAVEKAVIAQSTSDIEEPKIIAPKRKIFRNKRYDDDNSTSSVVESNKESDLDDCPQYKTDKRSSRRPEYQPKRNAGELSKPFIEKISNKPGVVRKETLTSGIKNSTSKEKQVTRESSASSEDSTRSYFGRNRVCSEGSTPRSSQSKASADHNVSPFVQRGLDNSQSSRDFSLDSTLKEPNSKGRCDYCGIMSKRVIFLLNKLDLKLDELSTDVNIIKRNMPRKETQPAVSLPEIYSEFPLHTEDQLKNFDKFLESDDNFSNFVNYLSSVGGDSSYESVKRCLNRILSNEVAMKFNWEGLRSKRNFQVLRLCKALNDAVKKNLNVTDKQIEKDIKSWLKHAKERYEGTMKKLDKEREHEGNYFKMAFVLIEFDESAGGSLAVIHKSWLTPRKTEVYWPPYKNQNLLDKAVKKKEAAAEETSDLQTETEDTGDCLTKRNIKKPVRFESDSQGGSTSSSDEDLQKSAFSRPPDVIASKLSKGYSYCEPFNKNNARQPIVLESSLNEIFPNLPSCSAPSGRRLSTVSSTPQLNSTRGDENRDHEQNNEILSLLKNKGSLNVGSNLELEPSFPIKLPVKSMEELEQLEQSLSENKNQKALSLYLATLDRTSLTLSCSSALRYCLSYGVAKNLSYLGTRLNKKAFKNYYLKRVIVAAVKAAIPSSDERNIEDQIKNWLKRSPKNYFLEEEKLRKQTENGLQDKISARNETNFNDNEPVIRYENLNFNIDLLENQNILLSNNINPVLCNIVSNETKDNVSHNYNDKEIVATNIAISLLVKDNVNCEVTLTEQLRNWAVTSGSSVSHSAITKLLHILSVYHPDLPKDCRTLVKTPVKMKTSVLETGTYCHLGLHKALENFLLKNPNFPNKVLQVAINIDGLPLYKSTNGQLWPILGQVKNYDSRPFPIGIFFGTSKPKPLESFLKEFISEFEAILANGFQINDKMYTVQIFGFICDAPARSYLKCIKSHGGYSSCEKCIETGEYIKGRVIFTSTNATKRSDDSFKSQIDEDHHLGTSPLVQLPIGMVSNFPIDYMHNVCLGVVKKLLNSWTGGPLTIRLRSDKVKELSSVLQRLSKFIPVEINRKCIYIVSNLSEDFDMWPIENPDVIAKCMLFKISNEQWALMPIVHSLK
ncbi:unnamed protein product [Brassicogethes aeneus]|uniref:DUF4806 domain-containing protein n=1 Tax=Brassicogethes aeneus TaxID=1431903 RepID=A0A9P0ARC0_BRAAE|nr:unnamed protein product [Brassicogethes aeneus]